MEVIFIKISTSQIKQYNTRNIDNVSKIKIERSLLITNKVRS